MADSDPRSALAELRQDTDHGAAEIARRARSRLAELGRLDEDPSALAADARRAALALVEAHPAMAPLVHLADETLTLLDDEGPDALAQLPREPPLEDQVADRAAPRIAEAETVVTYSRSGTVLAALEAALAEGDLRVLLSDAQPGAEGLGLGRRLAEAGAGVELTYDANLFARVEESELVLVGADAIASEAFVNKVGTRTLLERARRANVPVHVLASSDKLRPSGLPREPATDAQADWRPDVPGSVDVDAPLFERVPLTLADRIVTEEGPAEPGELAARVQELEVHPDVADAVRGRRAT